MDKPRIGITGSTGQLGGRVAGLLANAGIPTRLIVRTAARAPSLPGADIAEATYEDTSKMAEAVRGLETVFFVSGFESENRLDQHKAAIDGFVQGGVKQIVYTSYLNARPDHTFTFARQHFHTEAYMADKGLAVAALRDSVYADLLPHFVQDGVIKGPAGDGRFAPVTRADVAEVAAALLTGFRPDAFDLTGPELMTMTNVARTLTDAGRGPVTFEDETLEEAYASRAHIDAPAFEIEGWVTSYSCIREGELEVVSDAVEQITGHAPRAFRDIL